MRIPLSSLKVPTEPPYALPLYTSHQVQERQNVDTCCFFFVLLLLHNTYLAPALDPVRRELLPRNRFKCHKRMEGCVILLRWAGGGEGGGHFIQLFPQQIIISVEFSKNVYTNGMVYAWWRVEFTHTKCGSRESHVFWCGNKIQQHKAVRASTTTCCSTVRFDTFGIAPVG